MQELTIIRIVLITEFSQKCNGTFIKRVYTVTMIATSMKRSNTECMRPPPRDAGSGNRPPRDAREPDLSAHAKRGSCGLSHVVLHGRTKLSCDSNSIYNIHNTRGNEVGNGVTIAFYTFEYAMTSDAEKAETML